MNQKCQFQEMNIVTGKSYKRRWAQAIQSQRINPEGPSDDSYDQRMSHQASMNSEKQEDQFWQTSQLISQVPFQFKQQATQKYNQNIKSKCSSFSQISIKQNNYINQNIERLKTSSFLNLMEEEISLTNQINCLCMEIERDNKAQFQEIQNNYLYNNQYNQQNQKVSNNTKLENISDKSQVQQIQAGSEVNDYMQIE